MKDVLCQATDEATKLRDGGVDGLIVSGQSYWHGDRYRGWQKDPKGGPR